MPTKYVAIGAIVLILAATAYFVMMNSDFRGVMNESDNQTATVSEDANNDDGNSSSFTGSIADLIKRGGAYKCTFQNNAAAVESSGTVYVSGVKIRGEFSSVVPGVGTIDSHMIQDGEYVYTWSSASTYGFKAKATGGVQPGASGATQGQYMDATQTYAYNCVAWAADQSMFVVPAGIQFMGQ